MPDLSRRSVVAGLLAAPVAHALPAPRYLVTNVMVHMPPLQTMGLERGVGDMLFPGLESIRVAYSPKQWAEIWRMGYA